MIYRMKDLKSLAFVFLFFFLVFTQISFSAEPEYSALVTNVKGNVFVQRQASKKKEGPLAIGALLFPGDVVMTKGKTSLTIEYIRSGREEEWPEGKKFTVGETQTKDTPSSVIVKNKEILLPENLTDYNIGGDVVRSSQEEPPHEGGQTMYREDEHKGGQVMYDLVPPLSPDEMGGTPPENAQ